MDDCYRTMSYKHFQPDSKKLSDKVTEIVKWANGRKLCVNPKDELFSALKGVTPCVEDPCIPMGIVAVIIVHRD